MSTASGDPNVAKQPAGLEPSSTKALHPGAKEGQRILGLVLIGAAMGIPASVAAWAFLQIVHWLENLLWTDLPDALGHSSPPWYLILGLPICGAAVVALARAFLPGDGGHSPLLGIGGPPTPWQYAPSVLLAAVGTLAFGMVLGPEGPLIAIGSAVGMIVVSMTKLPGPAEGVMANAGSFSAVSALFGGPLVAGVLLLESGLAAGAALLPALLPGLTAAAVGYVIFIGLGNWSGLGSAGLSVPELPHYEHTRILDLVLAIVVGIVAAIVMRVIKSIANRIDDKAETPNSKQKYGVLFLGAIAVGVITLIAQALGATHDEILFSGQSAVPDVLAETSIGILLLIIVAKGLAYAICMGAGFRGGPVFPAILIGVTLATIGCVMFGSSITWAVAVGAAAGMTAGTGLVFSSLTLALLLTGSPGIDALPAAVLAVVAAWLTKAILSERQN
ncbi:chloride channel protein [Gordonia sp. CPCC 205515]|uniref:chloride channel protein n=1 Tax=Gordonia sp. CPCC 205515 TaxID=3140791 RepID=UPI003AF33E72